MNDEAKVSGKTDLSLHTDHLAMSIPDHQRKTGVGYEIRICRSSCRHSLVNEENLENEIEKIIIDSGISDIARNKPMGHLSHNRFKVSFSFCPNACTEPQIKDFGVIARALPYYSEGCTSCMMCENVCAENAVYVDDFPVFDMERCVGCGDCWKNCPTGAISVDPAYDVLIGGKLGRRPRFARQVARKESLDEVIDILKLVLEFLVKRNRARIPENMDELMDEIHKYS